jgi:hypothetical protein
MIDDLAVMLRDAGTIGVTFDDIIKKFTVNKGQAWAAMKRLRDSPKLHFGRGIVVSERYVTVFKRSMSYTVKVFYLEKKRTI